MLKKYEFGDEAIAYLRNFLSVGRALSRNLLDLPLESGHVFAYLPSDLHFRSTKDFECSAALTPIEAAETYAWLEAFVSDYLQQTKNGLVVFEHALANRDDPWLSHFPSDLVFFHGSDVFYFLGCDENRTHVAEVIDGGSSGYFLRGVLTVLPPETCIRNREEVSLDLMEILKRNARYIVIGAYDHDAYLLWSS